MVYAAVLHKYVSTSRSVYVHVWEGERFCAHVMDGGRLKHSPDGKVCMVWGWAREEEEA